MAKREALTVAEFIVTMRDLFEAWEGTENAHLILTDVVHTFGSQVFLAEDHELPGLVDLCGGNDRYRGVA